MASSPAPKASILNSWKEIACYLGRGVRTVQRWEHDLGMPVRRPRAKSRSAVIAMPEEIDAWLRSTPSNELNTGTSALRLKACASVRPAIEVADQLRGRCETLRREHHLALQKLVDNLKVMEIRLKTCEEGQKESDPSPPGVNGNRVARV